MHESANHSWQSNSYVHKMAWIHCFHLPRVQDQTERRLRRIVLSTGCAFKGAKEAVRVVARERGESPGQAVAGSCHGGLGAPFGMHAVRQFFRAALR